MNKILAIDLGTKTAFCWGLGKDEFRECNFSNKGKFDPLYYIQLYNYVVNFVDKGFKVFVEKPHSRTYFASARILFGLLSQVEGSCAERAKSCVLVSPKSIKKFFTGNGNASKEDMLAQLHKTKAYRGIKSHNIADAIALYKFAVAQET